MKKLIEEKNTVKFKSKAFAIRVVRLYQYLSETKREFVLSRQLLRSGTSIGANVAEAHRGQSRPDFISKMSIALKEAGESEFWLELLRDTGYIDKLMFNSLNNDCQEIIKMLVCICKTTKQNS